MIEQFAEMAVRGAGSDQFIYTPYVDAVGVTEEYHAVLPFERFQPVQTAGGNVKQHGIPQIIYGVIGQWVPKHRPKRIPENRLPDVAQFKLPEEGIKAVGFFEIRSRFIHEHGNAAQRSLDIQVQYNTPEIENQRISVIKIEFQIATIL